MVRRSVLVHKTLQYVAYSRETLMAPLPQPDGVCTNMRCRPAASRVPRHVRRCARAHQRTPRRHNRWCDGGRTIT